MTVGGHQTAKSLLMAQESFSQLAPLGTYPYHFWEQLCVLVDFGLRFTYLFCKSELQREIFHLLVHSPDGGQQHWASLKPGSPCVSPTCLGRGQSPWAIFCHLPWAITRELDWKWNSCDKASARMGYRHHRQWLYLLYHSAEPLLSRVCVRLCLAQDTMTHCRF